MNIRGPPLLYFSEYRRVSEVLSGGTAGPDGLCRRGVCRNESTYQTVIEHVAGSAQMRNEHASAGHR